MCYMWICVVLLWLLQTVAVSSGFFLTVALVHFRVGAILPAEMREYPEAIAAGGLLGLLACAIPVVAVAETMRGGSAAKKTR